MDVATSKPVLTSMAPLLRIPTLQPKGHSQVGKSLRGGHPLTTHGGFGRTIVRTAEAETTTDKLGSVFAARRLLHKGTLHTACKAPLLRCELQEPLLRFQHYAPGHGLKSHRFCTSRSSSTEHESEAHPLSLIKKVMC